LLWLLSHSITALRTKLIAGADLAATGWAMVLGFQLGSTFGAEFCIAGQGGFTIRAGSLNSFPPHFGPQFFVFFSHGRMSPNFFNRLTSLGGGHLYPQIRGAFLAKTFILVPASFPAYPGLATRTLYKVRAQFLAGFFKSLVMCFYKGKGKFAIVVYYRMRKSDTGG
jgi:hypothetical protein